MLTTPRARRPDPRGRPHLPRPGLRPPGLHGRRGGLLHRHDRLPGDPHRPQLPPPGRRHDRARTSATPAGTTRTTSRPASGSPATSCATLRCGPSQLALAALARGRARRPGRRRHLRPRHPRPHPPPARARRHAGRHLLRGCRERAARAAAHAGHRLAADGRRRRSPSRWPPTRPTSCRRWGTKRFTVAALDLGIKAMTPQMMAERGIEVHVLPATATIDDVRGLEPRRGLLLQRPGRPGDRPGAGRELLREVLARRHPLLRHLLRQPDPRQGARVRHLQAEVRPPRHQPAGHGPHDRQGRGHRAQPRLRRRRAARRRHRDAVRHRRRSATSASTTTSSRASRCAATGGWSPSRCSTTPRPRPARTTPPTSSTASSTSWQADARAHRGCA